MTEKSEFYETEKAIGDLFRKNAIHPVPPFSAIAGRIASGEPRESFEQFFAGEILPEPEQDKGRKTANGWIKIAGAAAAAAFFFIGGGFVLVNTLNGMLTGAKAEAETSYESGYWDRVEENGSKSAANDVYEDSKALNDKVSDSDFCDSDGDESSGGSR